MMLGARGITAQKISEAEVMADAGIEDILISFNILGQKKLDRLRALAARVNVQTVADNPTVIEGLSAAFSTVAKPLDVLIEIDGGLSRCGVSDIELAVALARKTEDAPGLTFAGFMVYPAPGAWWEAQHFLTSCGSASSAAGLTPSVLSSGGSPDMPQVRANENLTEYRAGSYIYNDRSLVACGASDVRDCALTVFTTVVSTPTASRAITDAGSKSLSSDLFGLEGYGMVRDRPDATVFALSEEHGHLRFPENKRPNVGEQLCIIPNHACVISNLVDHVQFVRGEFWVCEQRVEARGTVL